ncbi:3-hydroxy-3-methylglutaryl-CoA reductase, partial [archaeon]|nr:3-hydroxy-3-methylglutaryl-CoA reductase [archaeon]
MDTNLDSKFKLHRLSMEQRKDLFKNINNIKNSIITEDNSKPNIENLIGSAQVPLGIAGPLKVNDEEFFIPLATTEGALVASVARGCKVVNESGGATSIVLKNQQTRSILFKVNKLEDVKNLQEWVNNKFEEL